MEKLKVEKAAGQSRATGKGVSPSHWGGGSRGVPPPLQNILTFTSYLVQSRTPDLLSVAMKSTILLLILL